MNTRGRSELIGKVGRLIGYGYTDHPEGKGQVLLTIYQVNGTHTICVAEDPPPEEEMAKRLGHDFPGELFMALAQRAIQGATHAELKGLAVNFGKITWVPDRQIHCLHLDIENGICKICNLKGL